MAVEPVHNRTTGTRGEASPRSSGTHRQQLVMANVSSAYLNGDGSRPRIGDRLRRYRAIAMGLPVTDAACIVAALTISYQVRYGMRPMPMRELAIVAIAPFLWVAVFRAFNLYLPQHLPIRRVPRHHRREQPRDRPPGGGELLVQGGVPAGLAWAGVAACPPLELGTRRGWEAYRLRLKRDGRLSLRTLIVGTTGDAGRLAQDLADPASGFTPIGHVGSAGPANGLAVVGDIADLRRLVREHDADCFFVASTAVSAEDMLGVTQVARQEHTEVRVSANLSQTLTSRLTLQKVGGAIALSIRPVRLTRTQVAIKRAFDLVMASAALAVSLPLWAATAVAIRLSSRGPVFRQDRVTTGGRIFPMYKFRTMKVNVDSPADTSAPFFKLQADPRLTRVGAVLRRLSLDELPQLLNVLRGEMSLVGPRPLPADQVAANLELLSPRHEVPAGMTGWWQVNGRSGDPEEAIHLDQFYIENWSLSLDLYVILKTFGAVVGQRGAH